MRCVRDNDREGITVSSVVTIGNFDGLHLGHQALIARCRELREAMPSTRRGPVAVVTFEPNPRAWFKPEQAPPRLSDVRGKLELLRSAGVDLVWMMRFNERLATLAPEEFVARVPVRGLGARQLVVGEDFRFGHERRGDLALMARLGQAAGFGVEIVPAVTVQGERVSSTAIRRRLADGRLDEAAAMLGRRFSISGRVIRGQQLGRTLGYPTANIRPPRGDSPLGGIFAVRSRRDDGPWRDGVANLGRRPAVGGCDLLLEVHLFDFSGDLYGARLETEFVEKLRDEENFPGLDALVAQMARDEQQARAALAAA